MKSRHLGRSLFSNYRGVYTWVKAGVIHLVEKYQNRYLAYYKNMSRLQGK